jgi:hypothetical protein
MPDIVGAALQEWGQQHGLTEWEQEKVTTVDHLEWYVWRVTSRFGSLAIRFTELLTRRSLEPKLIEALEKHMAGSLCQKGKWYVDVLTNGQNVAIRMREEVSLETLEEKDRLWLW